MRVYNHQQEKSGEIWETGFEVKLETQDGALEGVFLPIESDECGVTVRTKAGLKIYVPWKAIFNNPAFLCE